MSRQRLRAFVGVGRAGRRLEHAGEIHMAYRGQRCFPPAVGAQSADPSILGTRRPPHSGRLRAPFRPKSMGLPIRCDIDDPDISRECERRAKRAHASKMIVSYQNNVQAFKLKERTSTTSLGDVHRLVWT